MKFQISGDRVLRVMITKSPKGNLEYELDISGQSAIDWRCCFFSVVRGWPNN